MKFVICSSYHKSKIKLILESTSPDFIAKRTINSKTPGQLFRGGAVFNKIAISSIAIWLGYYVGSGSFDFRRISEQSHQR